MSLIKTDEKIDEKLLGKDTFTKKYSNLIFPQPWGIMKKIKGKEITLQFLIWPIYHDNKC